MIDVFTGGVVLLGFFLVVAVVLFWLAKNYMQEPVVKGFLYVCAVFYLLFVLIFLIVPLGDFIEQRSCTFNVTNSTVTTDCSGVIERQHEVMYVMYLYWLLFLGLLTIGGFIAYLFWLIRRWF